VSAVFKPQYCQKKKKEKEKKPPKTKKAWKNKSHSKAELKCMVIQSTVKHRAVSSYRIIGMIYLYRVVLEKCFLLFCFLR
jgi:hypothetical protein